MSAGLLRLCLPFQKVIKSNYLPEEARLTAEGRANENQIQTEPDLRKPRSFILKKRKRKKKLHPSPPPRLCLLEILCFLSVSFLPLSVCLFPSGIFSNEAEDSKVRQRRACWCGQGE